MKSFNSGISRGIDYSAVPDFAKYGDYNDSVPGVFHWWPSDTEENYNDRKDKQSEEWKEYWKDAQPEGANPLTYKVNQYGFRAGELKHNPDSITFLGCSMTFGIGVYEEQTFSHTVAKRLGLDYYNLSYPGGSLDAMYRFYSYWQPIIRSKITVAAMPPGRRVEVQKDRHASNTFKEGHWEKIGAHRIGYYLELNKNLGNFLAKKVFEDEIYTINTQKNINAMKQIAAETDSRFILIDTEDMNILDFMKKSTGEYIRARDCMHPGPIWHDAIMEKVCYEIRRNG